MPELREFRQDGLDLKYKLWEAPGPTIIILHGLGSDGRQFEEDAGAYAAAGYRVIVPDLRAHGQSSAPTPMTPDAMHVSVMAEDVLQLMSKLNIQAAHFVGNSMGGVVALAIVKSSPKAVLSLATFGTVYDLKFPAIVPAAQFIIGRLLGAERIAKLTAKSVTNCQRTRELVLEIYPDLDIKMVHAAQKTLREYDYLETAKSFAGPILILRGDGDKAINKQLPRTLSALQANENFTVVEVADAGHFTNLDQPELVRHAILDHLPEIGA